MGLFNFPPYDATGSTGFLDPALAYQAQASLLQPQQQPQAPVMSAPQQQAASGLPGWNADSSIWTSLMGLGAGLAAGGAPGGGGWGAGIGKGLIEGANLTERARSDRLRQLALQNQIAYQNATLGQGQQTLDLNKTLRTDQLNMQRAQFAGPINLIKTALPQYDVARKAAVSGATQTVFGPARGVLSNIIMGIAKTTGQDPKALMSTMLPEWSDSQETRYSKVQMIDGALNNAVGPIAEQNQLGSSQDFNVPPMTAPSSTNVPKGGAVQAGVASQSSNAPQVPTPDKVALLKQYADNPEAIKAFDEIYGQGAAQRALQGGQ